MSMPIVGHGNRGMVLFLKVLNWIIYAGLGTVSTLHTWNLSHVKSMSNVVTFRRHVRPTASVAIHFRKTTVT